LLPALFQICFDLSSIWFIGGAIAIVIVAILAAIRASRASPLDTVAQHSLLPSVNLSDRDA
jgi:hypothetical protein